jgi:hypothetical protein
MISQTAGRMVQVLVILGVVMCPGFGAQKTALSPGELRRVYVPRLEKNLRENIVKFWQSKSLDRKNGVT